MERHTTVSARDDLISGLEEHACCFTEEDAKRMVNAFTDELTDELAEQWRKWFSQYTGDRAEAAPDLIDPLESTT